jgi:hypothetical protein
VSVKNCTTCKYFHAHEPSPPDFPGECRRYPPSEPEPSAEHRMTKRFTQVDHATWCGEYQTLPTGPE